MRSARREWLGPFVYVASLCVVALFAVDAARLPLDRLIGIVADDAFYYLQIARHLGSTGASTFDGIHATNGYHPGWMAILVVLAKAFPDRVDLVRACVETCYVFHVLTGLLLSVVFRRMLGTTAGWLAGALWNVNRLPLSLAMLGVEASFYGFALVLAIAACVFMLTEARPGDSIARAVSCGLALSLAVWARTEAVVFVGVFVLGLVGVVRWRRLTLICGCIAGGIAPLFLYSLHVTGSFFQSSGRMKMLWAADHNAGLGLIDRLRDVLSFLGWEWSGLPLDAITGAPYRWTRPLQLALLVLLFAGARSLRRHAPVLFRTAVILAVSSALTGIVYGLWYTDYQLWYLAQPALAIFVIGLAWIAHLARNVRLSNLIRAAGAIGLVLLASIPALRYWASMPLPYPWQRDFLRSQGEFEKRIPATARIGSFNGGVAAYFSDRTVINLDGLVNNAVQRYYVERRFDEYLRDDGIEYIIDDEISLHRAMRFASGPLKLAPLASVPLTGLEPRRRWLWRVER